MEKIYAALLRLAAKNAAASSLSPLRMVCEDQTSVSTQRLASFLDSIAQHQRIDAIHLRGLADRLSRMFCFADFLTRRLAWSYTTFGPGRRTRGIIAHIKKELREVEAQPDSVEEWMDIALLAFDGAQRTGASPEECIAALTAKHAKNTRRTWPPPGPEDEPIEHIRN